MSHKFKSRLTSVSILPDWVCSKDINDDVLILQELKKRATIVYFLEIGRE